MTEAEFGFLRDFLRQRSGLSLGPDKRYLVESRLLPLAKTAGLGTLSELIAMLRGGRNDTLCRAVVDAMATHETLFFRDRVPFEVLREALPQIAAALPLGRPLRIWSAAASTGQEAYSVAMLVREMGGSIAGHTVQILATDMAEAAILRARAGFYSQFEVQRGLPIRSLVAHFKQVEGGWEIRPELRAMVEFRVFNLLDDLAPLGRFDVILCRNLLIYLDRASKETLLAKLAGVLMPQGALCLGGAESALGLNKSLGPHPTARGFFGLVEPLRAPLRPAPRDAAAALAAGGAASGPAARLPLA